MRSLLRVLTVLSFAGFVVAATLAFSVRADPPTAGTDAGLDAGHPTLLQVLGTTPDRNAMAGSKSFGAPVTPPGFGLGGLGTRGRELVRPAPRVIDVKVSGPQSPDHVAHLVRQRLRPHLGEAPCPVDAGNVQAVVEVSAAGAVRSVRVEVLGDAGRLMGTDCLSSKLGELSLPPQKQPSTITLTLRFERAAVR